MLILEPSRRFSGALLGHPSTPWVVLAVVSAVIIGTAAYSYRKIDDELTAVALSRREAVARLAAITLAEKFGRIVDAGISLATRVRFRELVAEGRWVEAIEIMRAVPRDLPYIERLFLTDTKGTLQADMPALPGVRGINFATREWFRGVSRDWRPYVSPVYTRMAAPPLKVFAVAVPIKKENGGAAGILVLQIRIENLLKWIDAADVGAEGFLYIVDSTGRLAFHSRKQDHKDIPDLSSAPAVQKLRRTGHGAEFEFDPIERENTITAYAAVPGYGWGVVTQQPTRTASVLMAKDDQLRQLLAGYGIILLLSTVAIFLASYVARERRHAEHRFRAVAETANDAVVSADGDGNIVYFNPAAERIFGYAADDVLGRPLTLLMPERFHNAHRAGLHRFLAGGEARVIGKTVELVGRRKDGSEFPIEISLSPLHTPQGMVVTAIIRDISARKQIEQQRKEAQTRYRELMDNLPVGVYRKTVGANGQFLEVNPALVTMLEADSAEALLERPLGTFRTAEGRPLFGENESQGNAVVNAEIEMRTLKGRAFCGAISARLRRAPDGRIYYDGIIEDVTARKEIARQLENRTAELEAINRELEAFSYSVSHDLRAPLRAIDGFSRILLTDHAERLDETGRDRLGRVRRAAQHMGTLIDDLLKLSRVTRTELKRENVDLSTLAEDVVAELRRQAPEREAAFEIAPALHAHGDRGLLRIALDNLLGNAWKFTSGRADARISLYAETRDGEIVYVVADNGAGFDMAYADKLFGVFQRLHDAGEFPGTGIGLATVQRIVHKHGGRIWAESEVGKGARFYFTLEAERAS